MPITLKTIALMLLPVGMASCAQPSEPMLSATSYGKVNFGMQLAQAEAALSEKTDSIKAGQDAACRYVTFKVYPNVGFMVEKDVVTRADALSTIPNTLDVAIGDSMTDVTAKHPTLKVQPHKYNPAGHYLILKSADDKAAIVMEESAGKVTAMRAGLEPSVEYVERCL